jgi:Carboxypeptidase regulatory-like domain
MRSAFRCLLAILALSGLLARSAAAAGNQDSGAVAGRVFDHTGAVLPGVSVELVEGHDELTTTTDAAGHYRFARVRAVRVELTFRAANTGSSLRRQRGWLLCAAAIATMT